jgi:arylsulfatase A-like enzyme
MSRSNSSVRDRNLSRRKFLQAGVATGAGLLLRSAKTQAATPPPRDRRPNIILLVADDQRWDSMGCAGNSIIQTPNIDSLATGGTLFRQAFATTAICMSSRADILTGMYTRCNGIEDFITPLRPALFENTYAMILRRAGYRTGFVGKWGLGGPLPKSAYDYFQGYTNQGEYFEPGSSKHLTVRQGDQAVEFLRQSRKDQPFCLAVSFKAPHVQDDGRDKPGIYAKYPYDLALKDLYKDAQIPPPRTKDTWLIPEFFDQSLNLTREAPDFHPQNYQETMKCLYRLITGLDIAVGRILAAVRDLGVEDNTVIIYTSDHGSFYGEHGFGGKWLMYEESIRTPMIVYDPRQPASLRGSGRDEMTLKIDLLPTILELAGEPLPLGAQGTSLLPLIQGENPSWRQEWFYQYHHERTAKIVSSEGIRTGQWKYIRYINSNPLTEQLFDVQADPREENDLAAADEHRQVLENLRQRWKTWRDSLDRFNLASRWADPA